MTTSAGEAVFTAVANFSQIKGESAAAAASLRGMKAAGTETAVGMEAAGVRGAKSFKTMVGALTRDTAKMKKLGKSMTKSITLPVVAMAALSAKAFLGFDDAMNQSLAIMGKVSDEMRGEMSEAAREMAKTSTFSAKQVAEGYFFLASAGFDAKMSVAAMPAVTHFAQAGMFDLAKATDLATDAQSALGLKSADAQQNLENMTKVTDILVGANTLANASVEQFSTALTNRAAAAMRSFNIDTEEGVAVLAAWADQGLKGQRAGTTFDAVLRDLTRAATKNKDEFEKAGIAVFDHEGKLRSLADIVEDVENATKGMSAEQRVAMFNQLQLTAISAQGLTQLNGSSGAIRDYTAKLREMGGITDEVANKQLESMRSKLILAKNRLVDVGITIGAVVVPMLVTLAEWLASAAEKFASIPGPIQKFMLALLGVAAVVGPLLVITAKLINAWKVIKGLQLAGKIQNLAGSFTSLSPAVLGASLALGVATLAIMTFIKQKQRQEREIRNVTNALFDETGVLDTNTDSWRKYILESSRFGQRNQIDDLDRAGISVLKLNDLLKDGTSGFQNFAGAAASTGTIAFDSDKAERAVKGLVERFGEGKVTVRQFQNEMNEMHGTNLDLLLSFAKEQQLIEDVSKTKVEAALVSENLTAAEKDEIRAMVDGSDARDRYTNAAERIAEITGTAAENVAELESATANAIDPTEEFATAAEEMAQEVENAQTDVDNLTEELEGLESQLNGMINATVSSWQAQIDYNESIIEATAKAEAYNLVAADGEATQADLTEALDDATEAAVKEAEAALTLSEAHATANGEVLTARDRQRLLVSSLLDTVETLEPGSPLREALLTYISDLQSVPTEESTVMRADIEDAIANVDDITARAADFADRTYSATISVFADLDPADRALAQWAGAAGSGTTRRPSRARTAGGRSGFAGGGIANKPTFIVGEDAPTYPEFVIPTNPAYRDKARMLTRLAAIATGIDSATAFASGGITSDQYESAAGTSSHLAGASRSMAFVQLAQMLGSKAQTGAGAFRYLKNLGIVNGFGDARGAGLDQTFTADHARIVGDRLASAARSSLAASPAVGPVGPSGPAVSTAAELSGVQTVTIAAQEVVVNGTGTSIEVNVNNPVGESSDQSLRRELTTLGFGGVFG